MTFMPGIERSILHIQKVTDYLLNRDHSRGRSKCQFFEAFGCRPDRPDQLAGALRRHPRDNVVAEALETAFGQRYVIKCSLPSPDGCNPCIVSVWQASADGSPRFITAYPNQSPSLD